MIPIVFPNISPWGDPPAGWCAAHDPSRNAITVSTSMWVRLSVVDTGPGIPEQEREHVLEPFVRLDSSRSTPGSGLGLALVAAIVRLHSARIELGDNDPGLSVALIFPAPV